MNNPMDSLATRFYTAIEGGDAATLAALYTPDAVVWHNSDNREQPRAENLAMLATFKQMFSSFEYQNIRRTFFDGGFVQQHNVQGVTVRGEKFDVICCSIFTVRDNKIARIDEYLDTAQLPKGALNEMWEGT